MLPYNPNFAKKLVNFSYALAIFQIANRWHSVSVRNISISIKTFGSIGTFLTKCGWHQVTAPKKNAGGSISFLPTIGRFAKFCYFYVGKKSTAFRQLINIVSVENISVSKSALLLAPKRYVQWLPPHTPTAHKLFLAYAHCTNAEMLIYSG